MRSENTFDDDFAGDSFSKRNQSLSNATRRLGNWADYFFADGPNDEGVDGGRGLLMDAPIVANSLLAARIAAGCLLLVVGFRTARTGRPGRGRRFRPGLRLHARDRSDRARPLLRPVSSGRDLRRSLDASSAAAAIGRCVHAAAWRTGALALHVDRCDRARRSAGPRHDALVHRGRHHARTARVSHRGEQDCSRRDAACVPDRSLPGHRAPRGDAQVYGNV